MQLLVLAGGFGTRLHSVVPNVPKALAPISGAPFLRLQIENWRSQGLSDFVFLLHHQSELIISFLLAEKNGILKDCNVSWIVELVPMDTGGALCHAIKHLNIKENFLLINADTWLSCGIKEMMKVNSPSIGVVKVMNSSRYGSVNFDYSRRILAFHEKSSKDEPGWINAGIGHFHANLFTNWNQKPYSLEKKKYPEWVAQKILKAVPLDCEFIDMGIPEDYERLNQWIKSGRVESL